MRSKPFYNKSEIVNNLYTTGSEWQNAAGIEYIGLYHQYTTGETYTEPIWDSVKSKPLYKIINQPAVVKRYNELSTIRINTQTIPHHVTPNITTQDIQTGYITRFFIKKINESAIIEIDKEQFDNQSSLFDSKMYVSVKLNWWISGNLQDIQQDNVKSPGVLTKNLKEVRVAESRLPGIQSKLNNLQEFYVNDNIQIPIDINSK
jgi:hypothetical protein